MSPTFGNPSLGVSVSTQTAPPTRGLPTATDTWFVAAYTDVGPSGPTEVRDLAQFETLYGARTAQNILLWDAMDLFFREGGKRAVISRGAVAGLQAALDAIPSTLGPGQVSAVGYTWDATGATANALWAHALANNRVAIADVPQTANVSALQTYAATVTDASVGNGGIFGPWALVPAPAGVVGGSARTLPISAGIAALCARVDETGNPNQAAAGRWLPFQYINDLAFDYTMADRVTLLNAGINLAGDIYGVLENYGFQTPVDQSIDNPFWQLNCARMRMALIAEAQAIGENYMFRPIDGQGALANALKGQLEAMLLGYWSVGALYGNEPADAFRVEVGSSINTDESIAQGQLKASATVVLTLHAKAVQIALVTVPVGGQV